MCETPVTQTDFLLEIGMVKMPSDDGGQAALAVVLWLMVVVNGTFLTLSSQRKVG